MRILIASGEVHPYAKTGGLADMVSGLAKALARAGHQIGLVTPLYRQTAERFPQLRRMDWDMNLPLGGRMWRAGLRTLRPHRGLTVYFVEQPELFGRPELYQEHGREYPDNADRFAYLSKCVAHLARYLPWRPQIVHVHDWHVGLAPLLIQHAVRREGWPDPPATCVTVHNLAYQGNYPREKYPLTGLPWDYFHPDGAEFYGAVSYLKAAIAFADAIITVSPRYASEVTTPEFGCGLDGLLRARQHALTGILNGVDYGEWRTTGNPYLKHPYSVRALRGKALNKRLLLRELELPAGNGAPLFVSVTRLAHQKGIDILIEAMEEMAAAEAQFAVLGAGQPEYEDALEELAARHPGKIAVRLGYDAGLSHRLEAGADFFLMPSRFEPCGLNQMYSLRYGTVPIVRAVGGLDDSVVDIRDDLARADGIKFHECAAPALVKAMQKALALHRSPGLQRHYRRNGMVANFSWQRATERYCAVYERLIRGDGPVGAPAKAR